MINLFSGSDADIPGKSLPQGSGGSTRGGQWVSSFRIWVRFGSERKTCLRSRQTFSPLTLNPVSPLAETTAQLQVAGDQKLPSIPKCQTSQTRSGSLLFSLLTCLLTALLQEAALVAKFTEVHAINRQRLQNLEFALSLLRQVMDLRKTLYLRLFQQVRNEAHSASRTQSVSWWRRPWLMDGTSASPGPASTSLGTKATRVPSSKHLPSPQGR